MGTPKHAITETLMRKALKEGRKSFILSGPLLRGALRE